MMSFVERDTPSGYFGIPLHFIFILNFPFKSPGVLCGEKSLFALTSTANRSKD